LGEATERSGTPKSLLGDPRQLEAALPLIANISGIAGAKGKRDGWFEGKRRVAGGWSFFRVGWKDT